jgi:hypothetical protein
MRLGFPIARIWTWFTIFHVMILGPGPGPRIYQIHNKPRDVSFQTVKLDLLLRRLAKIKLHVPSKPNMLSCVGIKFKQFHQIWKESPCQPSTNRQQERHPNGLILLSKFRLSFYMLACMYIPIKRNINFSQKNEKKYIKHSTVHRPDAKV